MELQKERKLYIGKRKAYCPSKLQEGHCTIKRMKGKKEQQCKKITHAIHPKKIKRPNRLGKIWPNMPLGHYCNFGD